MLTPNNPKLVLIIEDDLETAYIMRLLLETEGHSAQLLMNISPEEAIQSGAQLIIMDVWMSAISGSVLCLALKAHPVASLIPIILCSAVVQLETVCQKSLADDYLCKPFDITEFSRVTNKYLA